MVATITILGALPCLTFFCSLAKTSGLWSERHHSVRNSRLRLSDGNELGVDVHYTMPKILRASIAFAGPDKDLFRYVVDSVMDELAQIALKTGIDHAVIDYTLTSADAVFEGNSLDKKARDICGL